MRHHGLPSTAKAEAGIEALSVSHDHDGDSTYLTAYALNFHFDPGFFRGAYSGPLHVSGRESEWDDDSYLVAVSKVADFAHVRRPARRRRDTSTPAPFLILEAE